MRGPDQGQNRGVTNEHNILQFQDIFKDNSWLKRTQAFQEHAEKSCSYHICDILQEAGVTNSDGYTAGKNCHK